MLQRQGRDAGKWCSNLDFRMSQFMGCCLFWCLRLTLSCSPSSSAVSSATNPSPSLSSSLSSGPLALGDYPSPSVLDFLFWFVSYGSSSSLFVSFIYRYNARLGMRVRATSQRRHQSGGKYLQLRPEARGLRACRPNKKLRDQNQRSLWAQSGLHVIHKAPDYKAKLN